MRAAIRHMYFENLNEELCTDVAGQKTSLGEIVALQDSSLGDPSFQQMDNVLNKEVCQSSIFLIKGDLDYRFEVFDITYVACMLFNVRCLNQTNII